MGKMDKPKIVVSRCLGFAKCRYNAQTIPNDFVESLKEYVEYITVCPEVEIGLGTPREPIRLILEDGDLKLYQPATDKIYTDEMNNYSIEKLKEIGEVDGFILKGRSPSCGIKDVKVYNGRGKAPNLGKDVGIFAKHVVEKYPHLAIEEEGRLTNLKIREHFLTKLYTMMNFKKVINSNSMGQLVKFHSTNKYLITAYSQTQLRILGKIVANHDKRPFKEVALEYRDNLGLALSNVPKHSNYINSLMHMFGYFSDSLSKKEKEFVLDSFEKYRQEKVLLSVPVNILKSYVLRYEQDYLLDQTIWSAFPQDLLDTSDSSK